MEPTNNEKPLDFDCLQWAKITRETLQNLLNYEGSFLVRRGKRGGTFLSVNHEGSLYHFKFDNAKRELESDETSSDSSEENKFESLQGLVEHYYETRAELHGRARLLRPVYSRLPHIRPSRLKFESILGEGTYGEVWKGQMEAVNASPLNAEETVAIKVVWSENVWSEVSEEAPPKGYFDHENVVRVKGRCTYRNSDRKWVRDECVIMEYCNMGPLDKLLQTDMLQEHEKVRAILDASLGLAYLHGRDIVHRDFASGKVLLTMTDKITAKVAACCLSITDEFGWGRRRWPVYSSPPESLQMRVWSKTSDVWSFGIFMMEVYNKGANQYEAKYEPANKTNLKKMAQELLQGVRQPIPDGMPLELGDLVQECLRTPADQRPTMRQVAERLQRYHDRVNQPNRGP